MLEWYKYIYECEMKMVCENANCVGEADRFESIKNKKL